MASMAQLLEEMGNWDKDKRFMAASDLAREVMTSSHNLDTASQKRICQAFLKQLEDQSVDVQGNAVKCLAQIVGRFQEQQIGEVMVKLSQLVLEGRPEVRDIYATCLKGLLTALPQSCGTLACQSVLPRMLHGITSHPSPEVKEECVVVFHDFIKRFGDSRVMQWSDQENVASILLGFLKPKQFKPSLRKKVIACIGALSAVLPDRQLDSLTRALLADVRAAAAKADKQIYIQCIGTVSRNVGFRIGPHLKDIAPLLLQIVAQSTDNDQPMDDDSEKDHEVVENCLNAFESFVLRCPKEMMPHLEELSGLILQLIAYDPNVYSNGDDMDAGMDDGFDDFDDEGLADSDDDDTSWKVRRASLRVLAAMVKGVPDRLPEFYARFVSPLIARFPEREETVKLDVFATFGEMAQGAVVKDGQGLAAGASGQAGTNGGMLEVARPAPPQFRPAATHLIAALPNCIAQLNKQLKSKSQKTRQGAVALLRTLAECVPQQLEADLGIIKDEWVRSMSGDSAGIRLDALVALRHLVENYGKPAPYQQLAPTVCPLLLKCCGDAYYKSIAQALRCIGAYVYVLRPSPEAPCGQLKEFMPVLDTLRSRMIATDIDQEVKESALECFGNMAAVVGDLPDFQTAVRACLGPFVERVKNEVTRSTAIRALRTLCTSKIHVQALTEALPAIGGHLSSYLSQNSRAFRQQCLDAMVQLLSKYGAAVPPDTLRQILMDIVPFITETDLYITDLCVQVADKILEASPNMVPVIVERCLPAVLNVCRSPLLQGGALDSILRLLAQLAKHTQHCPYERFRTELSDTSVVNAMQAQAQRHVIATLAKGLAAVISSSSKEVRAMAIQQFLAAIQQSSAATSAEAARQCELSLLVLGEAGKLSDLSATPGFCETLLRQLESSQDEIRLAAALALGYATVGATGTLLKVVVDSLQQDPGGQGQKTQYLLLTSLREVVAISVAQTADGSLAAQLQPHITRVLPILTRYADSAEESVRNVVSESLGHLLAIDRQGEVLRALQALLARREGDGWRVTAAAVSSVRFVASKPNALQVLEPLREALLQCLKDPEFQVRMAALHSVNAVCLSSTCRELIRPHTELVLERIREDSKPRPELVREVDLGPFKHKVDDGLALRKVAYQLCTSLLSAYPENTASPAVIDLVVQGLADSEDVQAICCQLLQELFSLNFAVFRIVGKIGDLVEPFDRCIARCVKQVQAKQQVGRVTDMLRTYARTLQAIEQVAETSGQQGFSDFMTRIKKDANFAQVYEHAASSKESL